MSFVEYLQSKNIDPGRFQIAEPEQYDALMELFGLVHTNSFTEQKRFLLNDLRRRFQLTDYNKKKD